MPSAASHRCCQRLRYCHGRNGKDERSLSRFCADPLRRQRRVLIIRVSARGHHGPPASAMQLQIARRCRVGRSDERFGGCSLHPPLACRHTGRRSVRGRLLPVRRAALLHQRAPALWSDRARTQTGAASQHHQRDAWHRRPVRACGREGRFFRKPVTALLRHTRAAGAVSWLRGRRRASPLPPPAALTQARPRAAANRARLLF